MYISERMSEQSFLVSLDPFETSLSGQSVALITKKSYTLKHKETNFKTQVTTITGKKKTQTTHIKSKS